ncbi:TPA: hypothetical protein QDB48_002339 [Burkholderia vietnamiensis]|nr:hypothetical protein [Burkholderia vietnamiensis]
MAKLTEASQWESEIYQLETSDPVEGGPDGIDNVQARQLGNRTRFLKDQHDAHLAADNPHPQYATILQMKAAIDALVASAPGALDTLKELADALGDDPNFATTMTNALALKAALDSPIFTGTPKGPTPPQFDNSTRFAPTEFVQRALGNFQAIGSVSNAITLTAADAGKAFTLNTGASVVLPLFSSVKPGASFLFINTGPTLTISRQGNDLIFGPSAAQNGALTSNATGVTLQTGDWCMVTAMVAWEVTAGSPLLTLNNGALGAVLNPVGYQKLPSGLIIQWGLISSINQSFVTVAYPIAFPNGCLGVWQSIYNDTAGSTDAARRTTSATPKATMNFRITNADGGTSVQWIAFGW